MELHTLGVDGGYTQKDVAEVARAFTGWTIGNPRAAAATSGSSRGFTTMARRSCSATHQSRAAESRTASRCSTCSPRIPSTARFIVDQAGAAVRQRHAAARRSSIALAARFRAVDGDLREVMRTLLTSPEFLSPDVLSHAKVKTPFEFVVSAVRATGRRRRRRAAARAGAAGARHAALPVPAADRLQGHRRRVGQHRRAGRPDELRADAGRAADGSRARHARPRPARSTRRCSAG